MCNDNHAGTGSLYEEMRAAKNPQISSLHVRQSKQSICFENCRPVRAMIDSFGRWR